MNIAEKRIVATILLGDIRNFGKIVNILSLAETHAFLNDFFTILIEATSNYNGRLDKLLGDAAMVVFGVNSTHDDAVRAVRCALDIQQRVEEISIKWRRSLNFLVEIDIGISTGEVIAGTIGNKKRMDYTVIGKNVNLAARINYLCKEYNENILLEQTTYDRVKDNFDFKHIGEKLLLGYPQPIQLYMPVVDNK